MGVIVTVHLNGVPVPVELDEQALATIAAAVTAHAAHDTQGNSWPQWMSLPTASRYLDMPEERLRKLVARAAIPFTQEAPGCRISFGRRDLDQWMHDQTHERSRR